MINLNLHALNTRLNICPKLSFAGAERILPHKKYPKKYIKLIALDIDGTISDRRTNKVSPEVKKLIDKAVSKNIKVILNTGRDYDDAVKVAKELNLDTPIICGFGKFIMDSKNAKTIYKNPSRKWDLKGDSLEYLANEWGIKKENIMAIGDDIEDASMFRKAGVAVLLEGSQNFDLAEVYAHYVTDSIDKNGAALALEKLLFN